MGHHLRHQRQLVEQLDRPAFTWVNQELQAIFDNTGSNRAITVSGTVIAHGLTFSTPARPGYSFTGGSLTVTAGRHHGERKRHLQFARLHRRPAIWNVASGKTLTVNGAAAHDHQRLTFSRRRQRTIIGGPIDGGGVIKQLTAAQSPAD